MSDWFNVPAHELAACPPAPPDGLHLITRDEYDALRGRANYSTLKLFAKSPAHYRHATTTGGRPDTPSLLRGRVAHLAVFEPHLLADEVAVWDGGDRRGNAFKAFATEHADCDIVTRAEMNAVDAVARAVRAHPHVAPHLADGDAEVTVLWTDPATGVQCKGRVDWLSATGVILDLKTCRSSEPTAFGRAANELHYHAQAAFYADGIAAAVGERLPFIDVAVESDAPHVVVPYRVTDDALDRGRALYRAWLRTLAECRRRDEWPGYAAGVLGLQLPKWAINTAESFEPSEDGEGTAQ